MTKVDWAGYVGAMADPAVSSSAVVAQPATLVLWPHVPAAASLGAGEMDVATFILVPHSSDAFGLHLDQHGPTRQALSLAGLYVPLP